MYEENQENVERIQVEQNVDKWIYSTFFRELNNNCKRYEKSYSPTVLV